MQKDALCEHLLNSSLSQYLTKLLLASYSTNLNKDEEIPESSFLKETHQIGREGLSFVRRNFGNLSGLSHHVAAFDWLELEVPRHTGVDQQLHQL